MFNANDSSMNGTCNTYVQYSAQKTQTNLRIIQEYFQPKIGRKIRIFSLGWKNNILIKKKKGVCSNIVDKLGHANPKSLSSKINHYSSSFHRSGDQSHEFYATDYSLIMYYIGFITMIQFDIRLHKLVIT